jgi:hypothetical protein
MTISPARATLFDPVMPAAHRDTPLATGNLDAL